ncbi:nuclear transport factor 2 family protein [Nocardioides campestrisoli]|nr:nuclear transport factor 2 family protein [Nocardioides campestrisoli]
MRPPDCSRNRRERWPPAIGQRSAAVADRLPERAILIVMRPEEPTESAELEEVVRAWDTAMVSNDATSIGGFMTDDWMIVGPDGSSDGRERFLSLIASGDLTHHTMTSEDLVIRVLGDSAIVVAAGNSAGTFRGQPFSERERSSNVFVRRHGRWLCAHTHLSTI